MLLALLLMATPASVTLEGVEPSLALRLQPALLPIWRRTLDAERVAKTVRSVYLRAGRFLTKVETIVDGEALTVRVEPSRAARILSVRFLGNRALSVEQLTEAMFNRPDGPSARLRGVGRYMPEALADDVTGLRQAYYAEGYIFAQVEPPQVTVEPDLRGVRMEIRVHEGERHSLGELHLKGLPQGHTFGYASGQPFSVSKIHRSVEAVRQAWMAKGHALVQVKERSAVDAAGRRVELWLDFEPGPVCTISEIAWRGLTQVQPTVLLRLMRLRAGDRYDHQLLMDEIGRLRAEGLIAGAQVVPEPGPKEGTVKLNLMAQDAPQRWFPAFTVTYLPGEGAVLLLQLQTPNLLGRGIRFRGSTWLSSERRLFDLSLSMPGMLHPLDSGSAELHNRDRAWPALTAQSRGASVGYGRALDRRRRVNLFGRLAADRWSVNRRQALGGGSDEGYRVGAALSLSYDDRDSGLLGTRGQRFGLSLDAAPGFGGALMARTGWSVEAQRLQPLPWRLRARFKAGAQGLIGEHQAFDRLYAGGPGSLRGFTAYSLSPIDAASGLPIGGDKLLRASAELGYGLNALLEPFLFIDAANAFATDQNWFEQPSSKRPLVGGMGWSWGFGILLRLPVLPFRFEWGRPMTRGPNDPEMLFSLGVGTG